LREEVVTTEKAIQELLTRGEKNRSVGEPRISSLLSCTRHLTPNCHLLTSGTTDFNARSSRSHTVLTITIESRSSFVIPKHNSPRKSVIEELGPIRISSLSLIDLAGSEKATSQEERRKEGGFINKSLLTLEKVIGKLTQRNR
jgi:centromeric protein E